MRQVAISFDSSDDDTDEESLESPQAVSRGPSPMPFPLMGDCVFEPGDHPKPPAVLVLPDPTVVNQKPVSPPVGPQPKRFVRSSQPVSRPVVVEQIPSLPTIVNHAPGSRAKTPRNRRPPSTVFRCQRSRRGILKRPAYSFFLKDEAIMSAKHTGNDTLCIAMGKDIHIRSSEFIAFVQFSSRRNHFVLLHPTGNRIALLDFRHETPLTPRDLSLQIEDQALQLTNCRAVFNEQRQTWQIPFEGRYVISSSKNAVIVDENNDRWITVRKTGKDSLEVEMFSQIEGLVLFFIAMAEFMCNL
jgi:hypothetical protein